MHIIINFEVAHIRTPAYVQHWIPFRWSLRRAKNNQTAKR